MKLSNKHDYFNACCRGCSAAIEQKDIDPDEYYLGQWLCGRCRRELEALPRRHKIVFDRLKRELDAARGRVKGLMQAVAVLEGFIIDHGLSPRDVGDSYAGIPTVYDLLESIVANAVMGPDPEMNGAADCYHVPLDDIDRARKWPGITEAE